MKPQKYLFAILMSLLLSVLFGCNQTNKSQMELNLTELALQGKQIFEAKECNKCHYIGDEKVKSEAPDLADPFIANNELFVQTHLRFVEQTKMTPIELTREEMRLLSHFVAELHRARNPTVKVAEADAICPVCYAPVSIAQAKANKLYGRMPDKKYYFECQNCFDAFTKAPEAWVELFKQYQIEQEGVKTPLK